MRIMMMMMKLNPKLVKPKRVDEKDNVKDKVAKDGHDHQWFPAYNSLSDLISICLLCISVFEVVLTNDGHDCLVMTSCMHDIYRDDQFCTQSIFVAMIMFMMMIIIIEDIMILIDVPTFHKNLRAVQQRL